MYRFVGKWHDLIIALLLTLVIFVTGSYLAYFHNPVWLNRAGSLIIIVGVILAVNRIHEIFENRFIKLLDGEDEKIIQEVLTEHKVDKPLSSEQRAKLKEVIQTKFADALRSVTLSRKIIFKYFEVWLIIVGTFLNGFGDYIVCLFKSCST